MRPICIFAATLLAFTTACTDEDPKGRAKQQETFVPPAAGTVIALDSVTIEESVNKTKLKVSLIATEYSGMGSYKVGINYGPDNDTSNFTLPKGAGHSLPILKKDKDYRFEVGFNYEGQYHEYCELSFKPGPPHEARFRQVKNYVLK